MYNTMQVINAMLECRAYITTIADGVVASAATFILMCGDKIKINKHVIMLIHMASYEVNSKASNVVNMISRNNDYIKTLYNDIYAGFITKQEEKRILDGLELWINRDDIIKRLSKRTKLVRKVNGTATTNLVRPMATTNA